MKRYITIVLLIIANVITIYVFCHWDIHKIRQDYRERKARAEEYNMMHEKRCELDTLSVTDDDSTAWYNKYHVIAHGGGGVSGKCYTNSIESWDYSYSKGIRVIDADVRFTSDSILVLRHYWGDNLELNDTRMGDSHLWLDNNGHMQYLVEENVLDYNSFINGKEFFIFTPMSVLDMLNYMSSHEDLYVSIDAKNKRDNNYNIYSKLVELAFENKASHLLDRCIANFYSFEDYYNVMRLYPFKNIVMRQYAEWPQNYYDLVSFCKKKRHPRCQYNKKIHRGRGASADDRQWTLRLCRDMRLFV